MSHPPGHWQIKSNLRKEALLYSNRGTFAKQSVGAYQSAWKMGLLPEICKHMPKNILHDSRGLDHPKTRDLAGMKFGSYTVLYLSKRRTNSGTLMWMCRCSCGTKKEVCRGDLTNRRNISCGCSRRKNVTVNAWKDLYRTHKANKKKRGFLCENVWLEIVVQNCIYCNASPSLHNAYKKTRRHKKKITEATINLASVWANGVDRLNNDVSYTPSNSAPCCSECNFEKSGRDFHEWLDRQSRLRNDPSYPAKIIRKLKKMGKKIPPKREA